MIYSLRAWALVIFLCMMTPILSAQTEPETSPADEPAPVVETVKTVTPEEPALPEINFDDRAVQQALEAREKAKEEQAKADRALAEAIAAQQDGKTTAPQTEEAEGNSLIPSSAEGFKVMGSKVGGKLLEWLTSPAFLAQLGLIILLVFITPMLAKILKKRIPLLREPPARGAKMRLARSYIYQASGLLRAILLVLLLAIGAAVLKAIPALGQDWLVKLAQSLAVVFLIFKAIQVFLNDPMLSKIAKWTLIPLALIVIFGYFDNLLAGLDSVKLGSGENPITLLTLIKLAIFGSLFFWLGGMGNRKGQEAIRSQESLDSGIREIIAKFLQIAIFATVGIMALSAAGVGLSGLIVIFSALTLGIGLGLQPIAANFVSGLIILFDRTVRTGDFIELEDGKQGFVEAINMRSTTIETTDGKDIMVPNTVFIESVYDNWTHKDPRQRYEVHFAVSYDTDIDKLEDIIIPVFEAHPQVLDDPEQPDLELREFGQNGIHFAVEFWCSGIDDGPNKFTSDLNFAVWRALKKAGITMPLPQREVKMIK